MKKIIIMQKAIISPLGNLQETLNGLFIGKSAIKINNRYGIDVPFALFPDKRLSDLEYATKKLSEDMVFSSLNMSKTLFIYSTAKGSLKRIEETLIDKKDTEETISPLLDEQQDKIEDILGIKPALSLVISNACASGSVAVEIAKEYLETNEFDNAVLFGFEAVSKFTATGFFSLGALSTTGSKPFDKNRSGLSMGEVVVATILSTTTPKNGDVYIAGAGSSNDANHRTGPSRTGDGLFSAIKAAVNDAKLSPNEISAVKCHGTSTNYNDAMEAKALYSMFGEEIPPSVSLKGAIGHTSGAGSLAEIIIASSFFKTKKIPPTCNFEEIGVEEPIKISNLTQKFVGNSILCLSAGFGGLNSAVIISEWHDEQNM